MADVVKILKKFTSRKWLAAISAEVGLLVALIVTATKISEAKELADLIPRIALCATEVAGMVIVVVKYIKAEAEIDKEAVLYGNRRNDKKKTD